LSDDYYYYYYHYYHYYHYYYYYDYYDYYYYYYYDVATRHSGNNLGEIVTSSGLYGQSHA